MREAQPGFPYQDHVFWDMAWAANGLFDYETAHPFLKKGSWRDQYVAERAAEEAGVEVETLFPNGVKRMRHSEVGDELIYKPDLMNVWKERPTFYLNQQAVRLWQRGILFYGYSANNDNGWYWRLDGVSGDAGDDDVYKERRTHDKMGGKGIRTLINRSRYDETWKILPQIYISSLLNFDQPDNRLLNIVLTFLSILGIICMRRIDLGIIFLACIIAKITFNTLIHGVVRYFDWVHVPMLVGLSVILSVLITLVWNQSKNLIKKPTNTPYKPLGDS